MKKLIIFLHLLCIHEQDIFCQTKYDSISALMQYFLHDVDTSTASGKYSFKKNSAYLSHSLRKNAFTRDSNYLMLVANIDSIFIMRLWISDLYAISEPNNIYSEVNIFQKSLKYNHLPLEQIVDSFIMLNTGQLIIRNLIDTMGLTTLYNFMDRYTNCDYKHRLFTTICNTHKYFYRSLTDRGLGLIKNCDVLHFSILSLLKQDKSPIYSEKFQKEVVDFLQNIDTSIFWKQEIYNYLILGKLRPEEIKRDSVQKDYRKLYKSQEEAKRQAWLKRQDSLVQAAGGWQSFSDLEIAEILWKLNRPYAYWDSIDVIEIVEFENLSPDEQDHYLPLIDTTLWKDMDPYFTPSPLDDGMRFDTFSNAGLIAFLDSLPVEKLFPFPIDSIAGVMETTEHVHLKKVCQILGDRKAYGAFDPDSTQQAVINLWIDSLVLYAGVDSPILHASARRNDASDITIRFGRLGFPCFIKYITSPPVGRWEPVLIPEFMFRQITETEVQEMVSIADQYLFASDTARAKSIGTYMYVYLSKKVYVDPIDRIPRRPVAPTRERQRWHDEYIWPLLLRMNHWYTRMK